MLPTTNVNFGTPSLFMKRSCIKWFVKYDGPRRRLDGQGAVQAVWGRQVV